MARLALEFQALWGAVLAYVGAGAAGLAGVVLRRLPARLVLGLLLAGIALHTLSLGLRWARLGHGPFTSLFEILSSGVWGFAAAYAAAFAWLRVMRPTVVVVMPVLYLMLGWMIRAGAHDTVLPPTYETVWLYVHVALSKLFQGTLLVAAGVAGVVLARRAGLRGGLLAAMPADEALTELAYRFMAVALVFDSLMLVAGAVWAQDAWGRWWAWDPLETWSFLTWLTLGFALHTRVTLRPGPVLSAAMVWAVFALAFLTFFGVPFVSQAPHKGAV
ncbi:cytochrome c biogenesis protein [Inmirania thermothiophila]|uniref:ABC-type transport system involved in cytochrome c biogenesis permease subunit n=1 Tax=Inmirania thermothiophila TaxID=1750597 RepID=A0A3N1Y5M1_9GAMM|nr:cytochrome c biogenesis protein CcsA [Inmirania thermothiophila]ROR32912.1 ABC-type transport system involved in cytochrome c biogenesis permease subunit [Inmirania thermothiophila]